MISLVDNRKFAVVSQLKIRKKKKFSEINQIMQHICMFFFKLLEKQVSKLNWQVSAKWGKHKKAQVRQLQ